MIRHRYLMPARRAYRFARKKAKRASSYVLLAAMRVRNQVSSASLLGSADAVVSLTSYGSRVDTVAFTIESIGAGRVKPRRLILWLDDEAIFTNLPASLRRLERRGLEVGLTRNLGPHTKYFPTLERALNDQLPLVTADDDILYPRFWLADLCTAQAAYPSMVHCFRGSRVLVSSGRIEPYDSWPRLTDTTASVAHFATGVAGVSYPLTMVRELSARGTAFLDSCPRADDIWLHWVALNAGVAVRQLTRVPRHFPYIPGTQKQTLVEENVHQGGNDRWIQKLYGPEDVRRLERAGPETG